MKAFVKAHKLCVINAEMGYKEAASKFDVPRTTFERYVEKERDNLGGRISKEMGRFKCNFNEDQEKEIVQYLLLVEQQLSSLMAKEFQLASRNDCDSLFNEGEEMADEDFLHGLMARDPEISNRKPESTSVVHDMGLN
jgi:hypothetical protein